MSEWAQTRFWSRAAVERAEQGWTVTLDGRALRTPARAPLALPTEALAREVAAEWDAQEGRVQPDSMPLTRAANSTLDKVVPQAAEITDMLAEYGATDLLCYRAEAPEGLARRQAEAWDPLLDWARETLQAPLFATAGVLPVAQPEASRARLRAEIAGKDAFALTSLHDLVILSGSLVIGLAAQRAAYTPEDLWERSRIDEAWQESQWGRDAEAAAAAERKRRDFMVAARLFELSRQPG